MRALPRSVFLVFPVLVAGQTFTVSSVHAQLQHSISLSGISMNTSWTRQASAWTPYDLYWSKIYIWLNTPSEQEFQALSVSRQLCLTFSLIGINGGQDNIIESSAWVIRSTTRTNRNIVQIDSDNLMWCPITCLLILVSSAHDQLHLE